MCPIKVETHHVRATTGGDRPEYPGVTSTDTPILTTEKCLLNSILATSNTKDLVASIKHFYLNIDLSYPEYMELHLSIILDKTIEAYNLTIIAGDKGWMYI